MNTYFLFAPYKTLYFCEFTWTRDASGQIHLTSQPAAFGPVVGFSKSES